jgi:hypothetical protein
MFKKTILPGLLVVMLASCTRNTNNTTIIAQLPAFTVNGVHDVTITNGYPYYYNQVSLPLTVQYNDSTQQHVTLSLSALPAGITIDTGWVTSGIPTFTTTLLFYDTAANATPGTYPITLTATGSVTGKKNYSFNLKVKPAPSCTSYLVGKYNNCSSNCLTPNGYADSVYADPSVTNKIWFTNFNNSGYAIYANYNCATNALTVPLQTAGGTTYSGSGNASVGGHYMVLSVSKGGATSCTVYVQ